MQKTTPGSRQQNPLVFYLRTLLCMLVALLLRIVTFAPLALLFVPGEASFRPWLALLCPLLFFFVLLPLRFSFAQALVQSGSSRRFALGKAFSLDQYPDKLWQSFVHFLSVLKWFIPLGLAGIYAGVYASSQMDRAFTEILDGLSQLGLWAGNLVASVGTFFRGLLGNPSPLEIQGGWVEGLLALGTALALLLLIIAIGVMRNSATRYVWAYASRRRRNLPSENRRRVKNRRWAQLGFALINLVLWVPFLAGLATLLAGLLDELSFQLMGLMAGLEPDMSFLTQKIGQLLLTFFVLYLPFLPLRRMITAFFAAKSLGYARPAASRGAATVAEPVPEGGASVYHSSLPEADAEEGLEPLSQATPVPEPVPAWPAPQSAGQPAAPRQRRAALENAQDALREAPSQEAPKPLETDLPAQPLEASPQEPQAPAAQPPRQDVEPSAFTIGQ